MSPTPHFHLIALPVSIQPDLVKLLPFRIQDRTNVRVGFRQAGPAAVRSRLADQGLELKKEAIPLLGTVPKIDGLAAMEVQVVCLLDHRVPTEAGFRRGAPQAAGPPDQFSTHGPCVTPV